MYRYKISNVSIRDHDHGVETRQKGIFFIYIHIYKNRRSDAVHSSPLTGLCVCFSSSHLIIRRLHLLGRESILLPGCRYSKSLSSHWHCLRVFVWVVRRAFGWVFGGCRVRVRVRYSFSLLVFGELLTVGRDMGQGLLLISVSLSLLGVVEEASLSCIGIRLHRWMFLFG